MRRLLRFSVFLGVLAGLAAAAAHVRRMLAAPLPLGAPAADEAAAAAPPPAAAPDDLALVWGIGPVYRGRLAEAGIGTFAVLAASDPAVVAAAAGVPEQRAAGWIRQAAELAAR
jgi:large subunit ribosomal protein L21